MNYINKIDLVLKYHNSKYSNNFAKTISFNKYYQVMWTIDLTKNKETFRSHIFLKILKQHHI
jgi:hypothetical protein